MKPYEQHIWILLTRVLSGEASPAETKQLNQWLEADPANRAFFEGLQACWAEAPDENSAYNRLLFDYESGACRLRYKLRDEKQNNEFQLAPPSATSSNRFGGWTIAASILLLIGLVSAWAGMRLWSPSVTTYTTSSLEQRLITLPDGSEVRLNNNSTLSFKKDFSGPARTVTLRGEAFFDVQHDGTTPFTVHAGNGVVRDIGTAFNVKQAGGGKVVVAMKEGRATLGAENASSRDASLLTRNQIGILHKGQVARMRGDNIQNYWGWMQGRLVFNDMRFDAVIRQLDTIYGLHSRLGDPALSALTLTAYTNNTSVGEVLDMIALTLDLEYRREGAKVLWSNKAASPTTQSNAITDTTVTKDKYL